VPVLALRGEFLTAYTPYQPEVSQGTLQSIFEYQSLISELLAMDIANSSMYEGGSSVAEAAFMAVRTTGRKKVVMASESISNSVARFAPTRRVRTSRSSSPDARARLGGGGRGVPHRAAPRRVRRLVDVRAIADAHTLRVRSASR